VEAKHAGIKSLTTKHIEQAENYGSRAGINWVLLTSGVIWQLYHLTFSSTGIEHELVFEFNFPEELEKNSESLWNTLSVLVKGNVLEKSLDTYYEQQKLLCPKEIVSTLFDWEVLAKIRQQLNREAPARLEMQAVFDAVMKVLNTEARDYAGNFKAPTKRRHHHRRSNGREQMEDQTTETPAEAQPQISVKEQAAPPAPAPKVTP